VEERPGGLLPSDPSRELVCSQRVEGTTKGGRSRTVSLDRATVAVLREHRRQQAVRGGVEPPTFRFSGLRTTAQDRPQKSF